MVHAWKNMFKPWILDRGVEYYREGCVSSLEISDTEIQAEVEGNELYCVEILLHKGSVIDMFCDCPYADSGENCKHMAAVLYAAEVKSNFPPEGSEEDEAKTEPESRFSGWRSAVEQLPERVLRELLTALAEDDPKLQERLIQLYTGKPAPETPADWDADLNQLVWDASNRYGYVDYDHAYDLMADMSEYMQRKLRPLLDAGMLTEASELIQTVCSAAQDLDMDDSDGGFYMLFSDCQNAVEKIFELSSESQRAEMHRRWLLMRNRGEDTHVKDAWDVFFLSLDWDEKLQQRNLEILDEEIVFRSEREYGLSAYLELRETLMRKLNASESEIISFWTEHRNLSCARNRLVTLYSETDPDMAISLLNEYKELDKGNSLKLRQHSEKLIQLYFENGRQPQYKNELSFLLLSCKYITVPYLQMFKEVSSPQEWPKYYELMLSSAPYPDTRFTLLSFEGRWQQLLNEISNLSLLHSFLEYEKDLREWSPRQTLSCYIDLLKKEMLRASNRKNYWTVIQHLKAFSHYPDGQLAAKKLAEYWKAFHNNRPAMKDELKKAGW